MRRVLFIGVLAVVGCQPPAESPTTQATPSKPDDYTTWPGVTAEPYTVDVEFFSMCRAPLPAETQAHEKTHGPHGVYAVNVRVSPTGRDEFLARKPVPVGTVVVKEKLAGGKVAGGGRHHDQARTRLRPGQRRLGVRLPRTQG